MFNAGKKFEVEQAYANGKSINDKDECFYINKGFDSHYELDSVDISVKKVEEIEDDEADDRAKWGKGVEFLMSCIAMSVGLGNIWRFPFAAYENGGGAFLIPYLIVLVLIGRPVYYMEMCLGQFTSRGNVQAFGALGPAVKGMGYGQLLGTICVATYYCCLMALTLFYLVNSFTSVLPWSECNPKWENQLINETCVASNLVDNRTGINNSVSSSELYFKIEVLKEKNNIADGIGLPEWRLTISLFVAWLITFIVTSRGVQSSGKASYFLAIFPYVILITLLIRASTLDGATNGFIYFIRPVWHKLREAKVWYAAVSQCFFSLNVGFGTITMYASYNKFEHNLYRDAIIVTTMDTFTSLLAGMTIFGILGNLAFKLKVEIDEVIKSGGAGLAFISYPEAIAKFEDVPWLFAILFFFMLFVLGVGSLVALQGSAFTVIMDNFPHLKSWQVSAGVAVCCFLIGLVYVTSGGQFILTLVDHFGGTFIFFVLTTAEVMIVFWWYGLDNFCLDIEFMLKRKVGAYWRISWGLLTPLVLLVILIYFISTLDRLTYNGADYPDVALAMGWLILAIGILQPLLWWFYYVFKNRDLGWKQAFKQSVSHSFWGPSKQSKFTEWQAFKKTALEKRDKENKNSSWLKRKINVLLGR